MMAKIEIFYGVFFFLAQENIKHALALLFNLQFENNLKIFQLYSISIQFNSISIDSERKLLIVWIMNRNILKVVLIS